MQENHKDWKCYDGSGDRPVDLHGDSQKLLDCFAGSNVDSVGLSDLPLNGNPKAMALQKSTRHNVVPHRVYISIAEYSKSRIHGGGLECRCGSKLSGKYEE